eukprot:gnl/TRDRNA2_/TRDRNA2_101193_c0_seq1.p1 gnl/TRDRNA2_/TRDRNA2_101193_c0~~gnl/TRDRNA2_/TRDRNA2_101193_c0_seq1.p1  ORF type:complete len:132 (-),score=19.64 gnl/TRDRNA2_/TRDRNA2_101193_c0_seq1:44-439(-)
MTNELLLWAFARAAERQVDQFTTQELASIVWAFAEAGHMQGKLVPSASTASKHMHGFNMEASAYLCRALMQAVKLLVSDFGELELHLTLWSVSQHESLRGAWSLFEHARCVGMCFRPYCLGVFLTEYEQRG